MNIVRRGGVLSAAVALVLSVYQPEPAPVASTGAAQTYTLADALTTGDPNAIRTGVPVAAGYRLEQVSVTLTGTGTARLPSNTDIGGTYVEWRARDTAGNEIDLDQLDASTIVAWLNNTSGLLPDDSYVAVAATAGGVATITNSGVVVGIRRTAGASANDAFVCGNAGTAGWSAALVAGTPDALVRGVALKTLMSSTNTNAFRQVIPLDASGLRSAISGSSPIAPAANIYNTGPYTHLALVFGHSGTGGAASKTISASLRTFAQAFAKTEDYAPRLDLPPFVRPAVFRRVLEIGDSNTNSTTVDAVRQGTAVQTGWTVRTNGANTATYETTNSPGVGKVPWFIDALIARGVVDGNRWYARRGTNGGKTTFPGTVHGQMVSARADVAALGDTPDLVIINLGANDAKADSQVAANKYPENIERLVRLVLEEWPNALVCLVKERTRTGDEAGYPFFGQIYDAIDVTQAAHDDRVVVVDSRTIPNGAGGTGARMVDDIHFSTGSDGGQRDVAEATVDEIYGLAA